jgi:hypothetical protein
MGRIFKTPEDDSTEATLRALHTQNTLDNYYEKGIGWIRTILFTILGMMFVSLWENITGESLWVNTVEWFWNKVEDFGNWVLGWLDG